MQAKGNAVILFDGVCNLCNASVQWVIRHDPDACFSFASIQSDAGQQLMRQHHIPAPDTPESLVLIENDKVYQYSTAALKIAGKLNSWHRVLSVFLIVPLFIRNAVYRFVARNRYRWWGKQDSCWLPEPDLKRRFLDQ